MPIDRGTFEQGLDLTQSSRMIAEQLRKQAEQDKLQAGAQQFYEATNPIPQQNLGPVGSGKREPLDPLSEPYQAAQANFLSSTPGASEYLAAIAARNAPYQPKVEEFAPGSTIGTARLLPGGKMDVSQNFTVPAKPPTPMALTDAAGNPILFQPGTNQTTQLPGQTPQMVGNQIKKEGLQQKKDEWADRLKLGRLTVSAPQMDASGIMGVVATDKITGETKFIPTGIKGQPKGAAGQLTSATRAMLEIAPTVKYFVDTIRKEIAENEAGLGPVASRWREFKAGKIGFADPSFIGLRTDVGLLQTALMRMHVGARGGEYIMKHFQDLINSSTQSPENLLGALTQIDKYADQLLAERTPVTQPGTAPAPTPQPANPNAPKWQFEQ